MTQRILFFLLCLFTGMSANAAETGLKFGVFPNLSTRLLVETYQPLADALSDALKRPVALHTAPDFKTFFERTQAGEYDLVLTGPHLAWLAHKDAAYRPLYVYQRNTEGILLVRADSPYQTPYDLRGKTIAMGDPLAITVMRMERDLAKVGLQAGRDYVGLDVGPHNNAALHARYHAKQAADHQDHGGVSRSGVSGQCPAELCPGGRHTRRIAGLHAVFTRKSFS